MPFFLFIDQALLLQRLTRVEVQASILWNDYSAQKGQFAHDTVVAICLFKVMRYKFSNSRQNFEQHFVDSGGCLSRSGALRWI